jgi:hypothetical protein
MYGGTWPPDRREPATRSDTQFSLDGADDLIDALPAAVFQGEGVGCRLAPSRDSKVEVPAEGTGRRFPVEVVVTGWSMSLADSGRAKAAPVDELPRLSGEQREVARKFGVSEEQWARAVLAQRYGDERVRAVALGLARALEIELPKHLPGVEICRLVYEVGLEKHKLYLRWKGKDHFVSIDRDMVDDWGGAADDFVPICEAVVRGIT